MELAEAVKDSKWTSKSIQGCIKENRDLIKACLELDTYLKRLAQQEVTQ